MGQNTGARRREPLGPVTSKEASRPAVHQDKIEDVGKYTRMVKTLEEELARKGKAKEKEKEKEELEAANKANGLNSGW